MLVRDGRLTLQVLLFYVMVGHLSSKVLGRQSYGGKKISKRPGPGYGKVIFHVLGGFSAKKRGIALGTNAAETLAIDTAFIDILGKPGF